MNVTRIIDDIGRVAIPKDIRRSFRWMGGDEIEIIPDEKEGTILLRQYHNDTIDKPIGVCYTRTIQKERS